MRKGFTLIEVLIAIFLLLIVFISIFSAYQLNLRVLSISKNRVVAANIANFELEKIRNLPYSSIGVNGHYPDGVLEESKIISRNNVDYTVETRVEYVIDSADGLASPDDDCPNDYKKATIKVSWQGKNPGEISFSTDISPPNLAEECSETGGILFVSVFDAFGSMVSSPLIEIRNPNTNELITSATPFEGEHYFSLPADAYKVIVSKTGYSVERTYGIDEVTTPIKPHPIVIEGELTEISFSIDRLASINVQTRGSGAIGYPVIDNISFNLRGDKKIGFDSEGNPVYKYSENHTTDDNGNAAINGLEWDNYTFSLLSSGLDLISVESPPEEEKEQPIGLGPDETITVRLVLSAENSLLVAVRDDVSGEGIFSASVRLSNSEMNYDKTQYTDEEGKTYFIPLEAGDYNIEVEAIGYSDYSGTVSISGDATTTINLTQIE